MSAIELSLMEKASQAADKMPELDRALNVKVFEPLDNSIKNALSATSLDDIMLAIDAEKAADSLMYFI